MSRFVPKEKQSKKARRQSAAEKRAAWAFSPVTRKLESKKIYDRKRIPRAGIDDGPGAFFIIRQAPCPAAPAGYFR